MKQFLMVRLTQPIAHVAGRVSHVEVTVLSAGRFVDVHHDHRQLRVEPVSQGQRSYDINTGDHTDK